MATLARHGLDGRFLTIQTVDTARGKPHPDMVLKAMSLAGAEASATVVVGDTPFDMEMARGAGAMAMGVAWGYHPPDELHDSGAHTVIHRFADVPDTAASLVNGGGRGPIEPGSAP